ncbi:bifunctional 3,4-dihydroxy-2-butanone-4-phosphate synthase/GTP cyclohydrolase II [Ostreibacterium oceani]|uniref:3,4-dihydroxy-2-butanone 4-phosphate synthase n=1 Tax=Ostreibacterium oceani TaxID=2654998 RepID=A0A6N7EXU4_9GAMM|nr:bifunctional 3,4-dihydroxy-2-butanone-4-phosphate synthase/GTP cyclohydrolase II [Ostreibacterium oceani]MPV85288.1 3,4-dihydroxy-2-butanone-4-phosphate synthase [Ostreibacterium oceani]
MGKLNTTEEILTDLAQGKMVIIMDDEDRENEGDLILAADCVTPEAINFMAKHGRGLICLPITQARANQLKLWPQSQQNNAQFSTKFTVSIEAAEGVTTGISAADRAATIRAAIRPDAKPSDVVQPGHVFPIVAETGGVLTRAGHTEAGCDLARLSGHSPAAVIVEILNDDGTMARRPDLEVFAKKHGLKIGTIADLIAYRLEKEKTVEKMAETELTIHAQPIRLVVYQDSVDGQLHYALVKGSLTPETPTFVRVHVQNIFTDLFHAAVNNRTWTLDDAIAKLNAEPHGVIVILADDSSQQDIIMAVHELNQSQKTPRLEKKELRTYGIGAQILMDLNVRKMRLLSAPKKFNSMSGFNLEVVEYLS